MTTILFNKPHDVLSQFTHAGTQGSTARTLSEFVDVADVYAAGRLDRDSEGLLVLTDDGRLQHRLSEPQVRTEKVYFAQVEGVPDEIALAHLKQGVELKDGMTAPAAAKAVAEPEWLWPRTPPIRVRKTVADSWVSITLTEGRNRQVRRMTAAVGHPTLRLIRYRVGAWTLDGLSTGEWQRV